MELCNEDNHVHEVLLGFVKNQVFENMRENDYFGLITMRSGKTPFTVLPLDKKHLNLKVKRNIIR